MSVLDNLQVKLLTPSKYTRPCKKRSSTTKIAIHWVGNAGTSALANRNYFESLKDSGKCYASSNLIVGLEGEALLLVPLDEIAYATNSANGYSVSIECCHPDWGGKFSEATYNTLVELCAELCTKYGLDPMEDIIRHYDVTGKDCPHYYVSNPSAWESLKADVKAKMQDNIINKETLLVLGNKVEVDSFMLNYVTYIPLRKIAEMLGATVTWVNKETILVDGKQLKGLDIQYKVINCNTLTFAPFRPIASLLGYTVVFDKKTGLKSIEAKN